MSLTSIGVAYWMKSQNPSAAILDDIHSLEPTNITMDFIAREHPKCRHLVYKLEIELEQLLIAEHYRNVTPLIQNEKDECRLEKKLENFDYKINHNLFLLNQAANRIESSQDLFKMYSLLNNKISSLYFRDNFISKFKELKKSKPSLRA